MRADAARDGALGRLAPRVARLDGRAILDTVAAVRRHEAAGRRVAPLHVGEPHFDTPAHVIAAAVAAMRAGETHYAPGAGTMELREAVAAHARARGVASARADGVVVTSGAKPMLLYAILALVRPGDVVLVPDPGFAAYAEMVRLAGGIPRTYRTCARRSIAVDVGHLASRVDARTRLVVLNAPHNPTGRTLDAATLAEIGAVAGHHDLAVLSDEIYHRTSYDGAAPSAGAEPSLAARTIVVDGVSKAYAMTGWRLGWGIMPPALAERVSALVAHSTSCVPPFVQRAGVAALTGPQDGAEAMVAELRARRDRLVAGLHDVPGLRCRMPRGAFYAWTDARELCAWTGADDHALARRLLDEAGVACFPGSAFGRRGAGHLRFSFAAGPAALDDGVARLREWAARAVADARAVA